MWEITAMMLGLAALPALFCFVCAELGERTNHSMGGVLLCSIAGFCLGLLIEILIANLWIGLRWMGTISVAAYIALFILVGMKTGYR